MKRQHTTAGSVAFTRTTDPLNGGSESIPPNAWSGIAAGAFLTDIAPSPSGRMTIADSDGAATSAAIDAAFLTSATATDSSAVALAVPQAVTEYLDATGTTLNGAGLRIGILSDSFNLHGGMATDIADGDLPPADQIDIVQEGTSGNDEGRAMAELIYQIAPGAQIYFYSADGSESDFAAGITALATTYDCNVIVDDATYTDEPFFQDTGVVTEAIENAISLGVSYFTSAGNNSDNFYQATFDPMSMTLPGFSGTQLVHDVGGGSPYEAVSFTADDPTLDFTLEWTEPFGASRYDIGVAIYSYNTANSSYTLVANVTTSDLGGDPVLAAQGVLDVAAGTYYLAFYESDSELVGGIPITPGTFKVIFFQDSNATIDGAGVGSGTVIGHEEAPGVNSVAAVNVADTPAEGQAVPSTEPYSSAGPGETYIDAAGNTLATPVSDGAPDFAATDGTPTSVFSPFDGTSAAAPNAAAVSLLMLQADSRLAPAQVTYLLERSAISTGNSITGGAGLIQADTAVEGALTASTTPIWTAQGGSALWSDALNWSDSAVPGSASAVEITDGLGLFTGAYSVSLDQAADTVAALTVDGGSFTGAQPTLRVQAGDVLTTGSITLGAGTLDVAGTVADTGALLAGSAAGAITVDGTGRLSIGAGAAGAGIVYGGTGGDVVFSATDAATLVSGLTTAISNFAAGDVLDLSGLSVSSVASVDVSGTTVTVVDAANDTLATLQVSGSFTHLGFREDAGTGTELLACFCAGTRIATEWGEVPVERLRTGTRVCTAEGRLMPVRWLGRSQVGWRHLDPLHALPVRVRAGALGHGLPARDLLVSPAHALLLDGVLVQAGALVNGAGIVRQTTMPDTFTYWHVELDTHALLLAEGIPAESFLDGVEPIGFDNWHERIAPLDARELLYPRCKSARQVPHRIGTRRAA